MAKTDTLESGPPETALSTFAEAAGAAVDVRQYGGAETLVEKTELESHTFVVVAAALRTSEENRRMIDGISQPNEYVSVTCILENPIIHDGETVQLVVFNDGGTGIRPVIADHIAAHFNDAIRDDWLSYKTVKLNPAIFCRKGLRRSEYTYHGANGDNKATTWYFG